MPPPALVLAALIGPVGWIMLGLVLVTAIGMIEQWRRDRRSQDD